ncbi:MAG: FMN adenylyltransferase / Riboflavin kinase [Nitrospira sp.]|jgi:riboflavin kinase/FMN adenylyltransferase|nr:MAG: FMN adenylyltransferase / Riboflavin kinase [Nitrospira sp.]
MKISRGFTSTTLRPYAVVTIGNFDGHHQGHRTLLSLVVEMARREAGTALVLTFDPHPVKILAPQVDLRFLTTPEEKLACFEAAGIDEVVFLEFTPTFAGLSPAQFATQVLCDGIGTRELFVGEHFAFGKGRAGRIADLVEFGGRLGFRVHPMSPLTIEGEVVSSTRIRQMVQAGDLQKACRFLGRPYSISGTVIPGARRGTELGWPTANLHLPTDRVIPPDGVYSAQTLWKGTCLDSVVYIGRRPTFGAGERLLEVSILDERLDLYGQSIQVQLIGFVREDRVFASADELTRQIALDVKAARAHLREAAHSPLSATLPR